jgi:hypothetical protein
MEFIDVGRQCCQFESAEYPLTSKNSPPILRPAESNTLSGAAKIKGIKALVEYMREFGENHG